MKLGFLAADLTHKHGWAHYSISVIQALQRAGAECVVLTTKDSPPLDGIETHPVLPPVDPMPSKIVPKLAAKVPSTRRLLTNCEVIHALIEPFAPLGAWIAESRPFFITGHGSYVHIDQAYSRIARPVYRWAFERGKWIAVSDYTADVIRQNIPNVPIEVIPNGVDVERFAAIERTPDHPLTILSVGAVKRRKGTLELVQAFAQVRESFPDARLHIVGSLEMERGYVEQVRAAIAQGDLAASVTLAGRVPDADLVRAYADADIFALPSLNDGWKFEGFGLSLLEASAAGLPVIGTNDCGAMDAVQNGMTGILVSQDRLVDGLSDALTTLLRDPDMRRRMGEAGRAFAQAHTWDIHASRLIDLYTR